MLLLATPLCAYATENKEKTPEKETTTAVTTTLQGTVDDVTNYQPLSDVTLTLVSKNSDLKKIVKTDKSGKFFVENIPAGIYTVKFEKNGYETGRYPSLTVREGASNNFGFTLFQE